MAQKPASAAALTKKSVPMTTWLVPVFLGWLVPGAAHFYLGRQYRGLLLGASAVICFLFGLMMRGAFFEPQTGDLLTTLIYTGGNLANKLVGIPYFLATWLGYNQPDVAGHVHDYGSKFLAGAGLLNVLALVDAYEIATGQKD